MAGGASDNDPLGTALSRLEDDNAEYWRLHPELPALISHFMAKGKHAVFATLRDRCCRRQRLVIYDDVRTHRFENTTGSAHTLHTYTV